jgi:hypothetical protein
LEAEKSRYEDFMGLSSQRFGLPVRVPLRLPVVGVIFVSVALLWRNNRRFLQLAAIVVIPSLLWWLYLVNKTSRYFSIIVPIMAILVSAAVFSKAPSRAWARVFVGLVALCTLGQVAGNGLFLYRARSADYSVVGAKLRELIPDDQPVYGAITFWMALRDHPYCSYERTPFDVARSVCTYLITGDRVMARGSGYGSDNWAELRSAVETFVKSNAVLVGRVADPFYGNLEIYRVRDAAPAP